MVISDKQALRRCVKQAVRRASVTETLLRFDVQAGEFGVEPLAGIMGGRAAGTPFGREQAAAYAALDALGLSAQNMERAMAVQQSYERNAYMREILDVMRAQRVLAVVPMADAAQTAFDDDRIAPLLEVKSDCFAAGRYGVDYAAAAQRIVSAMQACGAKDLLAEGFDPQALRYALLPVSEDTGAVLHVCVKTSEQLSCLLGIMDAFPLSRVVLLGAKALDLALIEAAEQRENLLIRLADTANIGLALAKLGTRFIPYASGAQLPEMMLGSWINARERIWQALLDAYLPLARSGYILNSSDVENDVAMLLGGNLHAFYLR